MSKKFSDVAMVDNSKWKKAIHREKELYKREKGGRMIVVNDFLPPLFIQF